MLTSISGVAVIVFRLLLLILTFWLLSYYYLHWLLSIIYTGYFLLFTSCDDVWNIKNKFSNKDEVKINSFHWVQTQNFLLRGEGS